ncbi:MAG: glycoside hydrolase family 27 protein [Verrucomicrobia bacterium]|nr:MAG: glycoside hydrolase family 27 protein [Verrucomicrobiota bacterium]
MKHPLTTLLALVAGLAAAATATAQKFEGLALTPPMGWNTWNTFASNIHEELIMATADAMVANGMRDAGYVYIVLDDTWSALERDADGNLQAHPEKFPSGMKALGDYLHERGFKFGIYGCAGRKTCAGYPGSWGHEFQDARKFAEWGVDYLKYDWCHTDTADPRDAYLRMRDALYAAGRPIVFSICEWGQSRPWEWAADVGHLWRTTGDITDCYDCVQRWERGWKVILDLQYSLVQPHDGQNNGIGRYAGPGHWNDPDMLEVGNEGLTLAESRAHFSMWCILAAPLMAGNDVTKATPEVLAILTDPEAIAIDQDPLGKQGWRFRAETGREIWVRELAGGDWAVALLNTGDEPARLSVDFSHMWFIEGERRIRDIWKKRDAGTTAQPFTDVIEPHGVALLRLMRP